jgi:hypothetical protein
MKEKLKESIAYFKSEKARLERNVEDEKKFDRERRLVMSGMTLAFSIVITELELILNENSST